MCPKNEKKKIVRKGKKWNQYWIYFIHPNKNLFSNNFNFIIKSTVTKVHESTQIGHQIQRDRRINVNDTKERV